MRDLVYYIATSLDGFIAREDGSFEDFPWDDEFIADLLANYPETLPAPFHKRELRREDNRRFGAVLMGRKTYEVGLQQGLTSPYPTLDQYVVTRSMGESPDPAVTIISTDAVESVRNLKRQSGRAIWICGGGELATDLFDSGLVDEVTIKLNPIVFGAGIPLFSRRLKSQALELTKSRSYPSGHMLLDYRVQSSN